MKSFYLIVAFVKLAEAKIFMNRNLIGVTTSELDGEHRASGVIKVYRLCCGHMRWLYNEYTQ